MYIVSVTPIKRGLGKETLSYISPKPQEIGTVIEVPMRNKTERGLVLSCEDARNLKASIKELSFELRHIEPQEAKHYIQTPILEALNLLAEVYAVPTGSLLSILLPSDIEIPFTDTKTQKKNSSFEFFAINAPTITRFDVYKGLVRDALAKKKSIYVAGATKSQAKNIFNKLKKGIEQSSVLLIKDSKKHFTQSLSQIAESTHPLLIVGTEDIVLNLRDDIETIIIENEHSRFWRKQTRPFFDRRSFLEYFAKIKKINLYIGDLLFQTETYNRIKEKEITEYGTLLSKIERPIKTIFVDTNPKELLPTETKERFSAFSKELKEMILYAIEKKRSMFIYGARRGVASQTICLDCRQAVTCHNCNAPVVLHKKQVGDKYVFSFICHHCASKRDTLETCTSCGSWRLESFGIGIQKIAEEVLNLTGKAPLTIDGDSTKTEKQIRDVIETFKKEGGVLVGTDLAFDYLEQESVNYSAVASFDSLFSIPDFRSEEYIMRILIELKLITCDYMLVQGRRANEELIETAFQGEIYKFIKQELELRKSLGYPPFKTFIKITIENKRELIKQDVEILFNLFKEYEKSTFPALIKSRRGYNIAHILLKIDNKDWPNEVLRNKLLSLPPYMSVKVHPESVL